MDELINSIELADGVSVVTLGQGTWMMGERNDRRASEIEALNLGLDLGMTLIDTAEMYAEGRTETLVRNAIAKRRREVFLVSKVYPHRAGRWEAVIACEQSLQRLKTDYLDLYLLHWRDQTPLSETVEAFEQLRLQGKIKRWGVSNFDRSDMQELLALADGSHCVVNQVLYHLGSRGIEWDLLPFCRQHRIAVMAYSPLGQGQLLRNRALREYAQQRGASSAEVALSWLLHQPGIIAIPKAANTTHVRQNRAAADLQLTKDDMAALEKLFPPPRKATPLQML